MGTCPLAEDDDRDRLTALEARLEAARRKAEPDKDHMEAHYSQAQLAWRMVIELVAGVGIGVAIGYGLDSLFGTRPWLMAVFTILGFAAGVKTMIRSAEEVQRKADQAEAAGDDDKGT